LRNPFRRQPPEEKRSIDSVPWYPFNVGYPYEPASQDRALSLAPVFSAIRFLVDGISTLPLKPYRRVGPDQREPMASLPQLFQFMIEDGTLVDWLSRAAQSMAIHGNAIGVITSRDGFEFPTAVQWRPRSEFFVDDNATRPQWYWKGRLVDRSELVHIPWMTVPGKTLGLSPIEYYALTLGLGLKAQSFGADWFASGGVPPGTFKNSDQTVTQEDAGKIKERLMAAIRTREPIVYGKEWDFTPITIPPEQAQFVETQKLTANQIAAIYGIAPDEVGGEAANSLTYSTEELRQIRTVASLRPWLVRLETGFSALLPNRQYVKFNADATVRADLKTRYTSYQIARTIGLRNIDELRVLEDLPPLPDGQGADYAPLKATAPVTAEPPEDNEGDNVTPIKRWVTPQ
jgi:HK97 family phage portal protein